MRTFNLKHSITYADFFQSYSLTKLPKGVRFVKQSGSSKSNSIPKYMAFDKNGSLFGWGGKSLAKAKTDALLRLNENYFYSYMIGVTGDDKECQYIKGLYQAPTG